MTTIELRRLALADLLAIEEIERSSYPTPWSRSMFAGELAKPSSICLGAFEAEGEDGALVGYLIVSRYVDAWHVMNVAVDPEHRGRGVATMLLERLRLEVQRGDVAVEMVDGDERQAARPSYRLRRGEADEQGADQPRAAGDRDAIHVGEGRAAFDERLADHGRHELEVTPRRDLGHDAAVAGVQLRL